MSALLIGATGLIGAGIARRPEVTSLARRATGSPSEIGAPPERWPELAEAAGAEVAVSALGTTMRAAGSEAAFRAVDFDMVVDFARGARAGGTRHMIVVSSVGADVGSRAFYLRTKGEMEAALAEMGFDRLDILRPGLLRGERGGERRIGERLGILVSPLVNLLLHGSLDRFGAIDGEVVAAAAVALLGRTAPGTHIHHNRELKALARG